MAEYELLTTTTAQELWGRIDVAGARFAELVEQVSPSLTVRGSDWSVRDVVGHVLTVIRRYTHGPTLGDTPRDVDRINADELAALGAIACDVMLTDLRTELKLARELFAPERLDLRMRVPFHGGADVDFAAALSNVIGEFLVHGRDIATTAGRPWRIDDRDAVLMLNGLVQIAPSYAVRSSTHSLRLVLSIPGARRWFLGFDRGTLVSRPVTADDRADVVLRTPPQALALMLYSRLSMTAALRAGVIVTGGRRPWRIARFPKLVERP